MRPIDYLLLAVLGIVTAATVHDFVAHPWDAAAICATVPDGRVLPNGRLCP